jgi:ketosteroid isomerase-like protein
MTTERQNVDESAAITATLGAYHSAMVDARTDTLDELLDENFSLVHITGYEQPKDEWFGVVRSGRFNYHRIDIDQKSLSVNVTGDTAAVAGRGIFDATINGTRNDWRLQFTLRCARRDDRWVIAHARYTIY